MKWPTIHHVLVAAVLVSLCADGMSQAGELRAWGLDGDSQVTGIPAGGGYVAAAAGDAHSLALRSDGIVVAWGRNEDGQCDVPVGTFRAIGAGADFSLAVRSDGSIAAWGYDGRGQVSDVPQGNDFVAVDGGEFFAVALKSDGSIVAWGNDRWGQVSDVPAGTDFTAVVAGDDHAVAVRSDGSLAAWGYWAAVEGMPTTGAFTAIAAGGTFCVALRDDGSIVWWGDDPHGYDLDLVPRGEDYVAVAAGYLHALALRRDGSVVAWGAGADASGHPNWGQAMPPEGSGFQAIAGGLYFSLAVIAETETDNPDNGKTISDDFNDSRLAGLWSLSGDDLANCMLVEQNQRLELITTSKTTGTPTYCLGDWQFDPSGDFSFRVDYHYSAITDEGGWIFLGIVPDANDPEGRYVKAGVGCDRQSPYLWYEVSAGSLSQLRSSARRQDDGVLYVSYSAVHDRLYLGDRGYGSENAAMTIAGVLRAAWGNVPVTVFLGGGTNALGLTSGEAWFDNFVVDTGTLYAEPVVRSFSEVYRFWSPVLMRHFYTIDQAERDSVIRDYPDIWTYEGPVFKVATSAFESGLSPVYRFWSLKGQGHFYTIDETEKDELIVRGSDIWTFEGIVFYAYPEGAQPADTLPVYRFVKASDGSYFYTIDESERDWLLKEHSDVYVYEGVAFYAYAL